MRTLVVEDDFTSRILLQTFLSQFGECHIAVNGREAVTAFRADRAKGETYDLICMDIMMPEMDSQAAVKGNPRHRRSRGQAIQYRNKDHHGYRAGRCEECRSVIQVIG